MRHGDDAFLNGRCDSDGKVQILMSDDALQRSVLPIPDRTHVGLTTYDAKDPDTSYPPIRDSGRPKGAPNVLVVLIDDAGFGASAPSAARCHADGRAAGRRRAEVQPLPHDGPVLADAGSAAERAQPPRGRAWAASPRSPRRRPATTRFARTPRAPLAETLKLNGYSTAQFGKCHEVPVWQTSPMGPFDNWPSGGGGFEHFYGFIGGETNQYAPAIYHNTTPIEPDRRPRRGLPLHRGHDRQGHRLGAPAEGADARQAVLHLLRARARPMRRTTCRTEWSDKYKGKFDARLGRAAGADLRRQKELGRHPGGRRADGAPAEIPAWDDMPAEMKPVLARQMEVYAGFLEHTDHHVGRLIDALDGPRGPRRHARLLHHRRQRRLGRGHAQRHLQRADDAQRRGATLETPEFLAAASTSSATPEAYNHYAVGWAHAMDTPYQWTKQVASHWGGTRNGTIVHWPKRHQGQGRDPQPVQPRHRRRADGPRRGRPARADVRARRPADAAPGREACGRPFDDADGARAAETQYFEMFVNRGIYHQGWTAVTRHSTPWVMAAQCRPSTTTSGSSTRRTTGPRPTTCRGEQPEQAARAAAPLPDRGDQVQRPAARRSAGRTLQPRPRGSPDLIQGKTPDALRRDGRLSENSVLNIKNKSHAVTAEIVIPDGTTPKA